MRALILVVLVALVAFAGCTGSVPGTGPGTTPTPTGTSSPSGPPPTEWASPSYDLAGSRFAPDAGIAADNIAELGLAWRFDTDGAVTGTPTVADGRVYVATWQGSVYSIDLATGGQVWRHDHGAQVDATVTLWEDLAFFGDARGVLTALDAGTGAVRWSVRVDETTSAHLYASPVVADGVLIQPVASDQESARIHGDRPVDFRGKVVALDPRTGDEEWRTFLVPEGRTGAPVWGGVVVVDGLVVFGTGNAYTEPADPMTDAVVALHLSNGTVAWSFQATKDDVFTQRNPVSPDHDFGSTPSVFTADDGRRLVGIGQKSSIYWAIDARLGEVVWTHGEVRAGEGIIADSAAGQERVIVNQVTLKTTTALSPAGEALWRYDAGSTLLADPALVPGAVLVGDAEGDVVALALDDGRVLWNATTGGAGGVFGGLAVAGGHVLVPTVPDGYLGPAGSVLAFAPGGRGVVSTGGPSAPDADVLLKDFAFAPAEIRVTAGEPVRWANADGIHHTVTSGWDDGATFDLEAGADGTVEWTFTEPGTYTVYCKPHASKQDGEWRGMVGRVVVE